MDPRQFQQAAREFFAADNALRAAPDPTVTHVIEYCAGRFRLDREIEKARGEFTEQFGALLRDMENVVQDDDETTEEEEQHGSD